MKKKTKLKKLGPASEGANDPEKLNTDYLFVSPVWWKHKPEWVESLNTASDPYIAQAKKNMGKQIKERNKKFGNRKDHGFIYHSGPLIGDPKFKTLQDYIGATAYNLLTEQGFDLTNFTLNITELWVQEFAEHGGGHHSLHTHWNGHISGFYFLKGGDNTSRPLFEDPRPGRLMNLLPQKDSRVVSIASHQINYAVKPGFLIFFNSFMPHLYLVDDGYDPFRFIHFNIQAIPNSVLGKPYIQTEEDKRNAPQ